MLAVAYLQSGLSRLAGPSFRNSASGSPSVSFTSGTTLMTLLNNAPFGPSATSVTDAGSVGTRSTIGLYGVLFVLADASDHTLDACAVVILLAFGAGTYGHVIHSRTLILAAIFAIGAICLYFVASGELQTFN